jgi:4-hydroxybenzoate polyprenyltransferase
MQTRPSWISIGTVLRPVLRLFRVPNVFTAFANVVAGVVLVRGGRFEAGDLAIVGASGCLYLAGMVLNDYFDREVDAAERPDRPIPSGEVGASTAATLGAVLMLAGLALAATGGLLTLVVAVALGTAVLGYDGGLKGTPLGPWAMGACRLLNVLLGMSVLGAWPTGWPWALPITLGLFTVCITLFSRHEVAGTSARHIRRTVLAVAVLGVGVAALAVAWAAMADPRRLMLVAVLLAMLGIRGARLFAPLWNDARPPTLGRAIGGGILLMPTLDATFVAAAGHPLGALAVVGLTLPALLLKRWYYLT